MFLIFFFFIRMSERICTSKYVRVRIIYICCYVFLFCVQVMKYEVQWEGLETKQNTFESLSKFRDMGVEK